MGAFDLGEEAYQLELAGKAGDRATLKTLYPPFAEALHQMIARVGDYVEKYLQSDKASEGEIAEAFDPELVEKLRAACEQMDYMAAEDILNELRKRRYPEALEQKLDKLADCCRTFDYDLLDALVLKL